DNLAGRSCRTAIGIDPSSKLWSHGADFKIGNWTGLRRAAGRIGGSHCFGAKSKRQFEIGSIAGSEPDHAEPEPGRSDADDGFARPARHQKESPPNLERRKLPGRLPVQNCR